MILTLIIIANIPFLTLLIYKLPAVFSDADGLDSRPHPRCFYVAGLRFMERLILCFLPDMRKFP
jgi:hypothetical protein